MLGPVDGELFAAVLEAAGLSIVERRRNLLVMKSPLIGRFLVIRTDIDLTEIVIDAHLRNAEIGRPEFFDLLNRVRQDRD